MTIGHVFYKGIKVGLEVTGTSEVTNINGSKELHVHIVPIIPRGPGGPGEPMPIAEAA